MHQTRYVTNRSINRMGLNINKKADYILKEDTSFLTKVLAQV